jgi:hypothetical protein
LCVVFQPLEDGSVEVTAACGVGGIRIGIDNQWYVWPIFPKVVQQRQTLVIHDDRIDLAVLENVGYVLSFQPVVDR